MNGHPYIFYFSGILLIAGVVILTSIIKMVLLGKITRIFFVSKTDKPFVFWSVFMGFCILDFCFLALFVWAHY